MWKIADNQTLCSIPPTLMAQAAHNLNYENYKNAKLTWKYLRVENLSTTHLEDQFNVIAKNGYRRTRNWNRQDANCCARKGEIQRSWKRIQKIRVLIALCICEPIKGNYPNNNVICRGIIPIAMHSTGESSQSQHTQCVPVVYMAFSWRTVHTVRARLLQAQ